MTTWLPRGLLFAIGMVLLRLVQGALINAFPTNAGVISVTLCAIFGLVAFGGGLFDGMADARANPDPDRRRDLAVRWLMSGLVAGVLSGLVTWIISLIYSGVYADRFGPELVVFPAFTTLLIFLPAMIGVSLGRWLVDRRRPTQHRQSGSDVFEEVSRDEDPTAEHPVSRESLDWRQDAREAVRDEHETVEQITNDLNQH